MKTRPTASPAAFLVAVLALCGPAGAQAPGAPPDEPAPRPFALRDGDRVVFYGDSITQDGGYTRFVEEYVATRFPGWDVRFYNAGVGGGGKIDERLERDVVALRPTVVTVMLGMNDGRYKPYDAATFASFAEGYRSLVARLQKALPGVRLTLIRPSPYDDVARPPAFVPGYDDVLRRYGCYVGALAAREGALDVDFRGPLNAGLAAVHALDPDLARQILPDRVHPSSAGHLVMGAVLLRAWNAPAVVTRVELGADPPVVVSAENTAVRDLGVVEGALRWTQLDRALPLPLNFTDADVQLAEEAGAAIEELDRQLLVVSGLGPGRYDLTIDGESVGTFEPKELGAGVNLARRGTPMRWQAYSVRWSAGDRQEIERVRRRLLAVGKDAARDAVAAEALAAEDEAMQQQRATEVRPRPRTYELARR
jgi:lysophospholipase L1-like esterase